MSVRHRIVSTVVIDDPEATDERDDDKVVAGE